MNYLLITHIAFARAANGAAVTDALWARDLEGLVASIGPVRVAAPELKSADSLKTWGPNAIEIAPDSGISFVGLPSINSRWEVAAKARLRSALRREVGWADLVHTSNYFPPYVSLSFAHDEAVQKGKKTVFVIAEDFYDMLEWEWVRTSGSEFDRWRRRRTLAALDRRVKKSAATATLTLMHTPAATARYRLHARNGLTIRQPGHEADDVISEERLATKCDSILKGEPLVIVAACRHKELKGLDFLISAIAVLARQGIKAEARIYGEGELTVSLKAMAQRLGVSDRITFSGALPAGQAVYQAIADGHLFAMPHRTTDFGRAFFDAMAGGSPVVAFRTLASAETVRDGVDGLLTSLDEMESYAAAIRRLHHNRQQLVEFSHAARERALINTRSAWYQWRAEWTRNCLE